MSKRSTTKISTNPDVDAWFENLEHPQRELMMEVRTAILKADPRMEECVKWSTPTFMYQGNLASIQPNAKKFVSLLVHNGAEIPGDHPNLEGSSRLARTMKFHGADDLKEKAGDVKALVKAWCDWKEE